MTTGSGDGVAWLENHDESWTEADGLAQIEATRRAAAEARSRDLSPLVGLRVRDAVQQVEQMGLHARVFDERNRIGRADFDPSRVNLDVVQGRVHRSTAG